MFATSAIARKAFHTPKTLYSCIGILVTFFLAGCELEKSILTPKNAPVGGTNVYSSQWNIGSGVIYESFQSGGLPRHRLSVKNVSTMPRGFGAFNINGLTELLFEESHIEIFPSQYEASNLEYGNSEHEVFSESLRDIARDLPDQYGVISRIRMQDIKITLYDASGEGSTIRISADKLLKNFGEDDAPELYGVKFYDSKTNNWLEAPHVRWMVEEGKFIVLTESRG